MGAGCFILGSARRCVTTVRRLEEILGRDAELSGERQDRPVLETAVDPVLPAVDRQLSDTEPLGQLRLRKMRLEARPADVLSVDHDRKRSLQPRRVSRMEATQVNLAEFVGSVDHLDVAAIPRPTGRSLPFPRLVKAARDACGWSQTRLMAESGLHRMDVYRFEAGVHSPSATKALQLVVALEIPPAVMLAAIEGDEQAVEAYITLLAVEILSAGVKEASERAQPKQKGARRRRSRKAGEPPARA